MTYLQHILEFEWQWRFSQRYANVYGGEKYKLD